MQVRCDVVVRRHEMGTGDPLPPQEFQERRSFSHRQRELLQQWKSDARRSRSKTDTLGNSLERRVCTMAQIPLVCRRRPGEQTRLRVQERHLSRGDGEAAYFRPIALEEVRSECPNSNGFALGRWANGHRFCGEERGGQRIVSPIEQARRDTVVLCNCERLHIAVLHLTAKEVAERATVFLLVLQMPEEVGSVCRMSGTIRKKNEIADQCCLSQSVQ